MTSRHYGDHQFELASVIGGQSAGTWAAFGSRSALDLMSMSYNVWTLTSVTSALTVQAGDTSGTTANNRISALVNELVRRGILIASA